jgi:hypothetical protein
MVTLFKGPEGEPSLDNRIAGLSSRRQRIIANEPPQSPPVQPTPPAPGWQPPALEPEQQPSPVNGARPVAVQPPMPGPQSSEPMLQPATSGQEIAEPAQPTMSMEERLTAAREELIARLTVEIRPERRTQLTRGDLAKIVDAAVQAYFIRFAVDANPLERRDLVTAIMQALLVVPGANDGGGKTSSHRGVVEAAKTASSR